MPSSRKSSHESALNCCETILQLYSVFVFRIAAPPHRPVCVYSPKGNSLLSALSAPQIRSRDAFGSNDKVDRLAAKPTANAPKAKNEVTFISNALRTGHSTDD